MKFIEFTGVPGSGKSSIFKSLEKDYLNAEKTCYFGIEKLVTERMNPEDIIYNYLSKILPSFLNRKLKSSYYYNIQHTTELIKYIEDNHDITRLVMESIGWNGDIFGDKYISTCLQPHAIRMFAEVYLKKNEVFVNEPPEIAIAYTAMDIEEKGMAEAVAINCSNPAKTGNAGWTFDLSFIDNPLALGCYNEIALFIDWLPSVECPKPIQLLFSN